MTILDALADANLLGAAFPEPGTWTAWRAFLAACFGLDLDADQAAIFTKHTGRTALPSGPAREAVEAVIVPGRHELLRMPGVSAARRGAAGTRSTIRRTGMTTSATPPTRLARGCHEYLGTGEVIRTSAVR